MGFLRVVSIVLQEIASAKVGALQMSLFLPIRACPQPRISAFISETQRHLTRRLSLAVWVLGETCELPCRVQWHEVVGAAKDLSTMR